MPQMNFEADKTDLDGPYQVLEYEFEQSLVGQLVTPRKDAFLHGLSIKYQEQTFTLTGFYCRGVSKPWYGSAWEAITADGTRLLVSRIIEK